MQCSGSVADDNTLVVEEFEEGKEEQQWKIKDDTIRNKATKKVLDIAQNNEDSGARICCWDSSGGDNQQWEFEYL